VSDLPAVVLLGVASGLQAALLGIGIVLVYRANRFINFAQGPMGSVASAALAVLVFRFALPYPVALPVALALGVGTAVAVERLLEWRLFGGSRLALLVATIGVSQLILMLVMAGPLQVDPGRLATDGYPQLFHLRWTVGSAVLTSSQVLTIVVAPAIAIGLSLFLARTRTGRAIRGAASNPDAARLAGISVRQVSLVVGALAGGVSSVAAILYAPSQPAIGWSDSGPGLLLRGLAAALLAGLLDFRLAVAAGVAIGIVEQATVFYTDVAGLTDVVLAVALALGLLLRARVLLRDLRGDNLVVERSTPPLPERVRHLVAVRHAGRLGWCVLFAFVALAPLFSPLRTQERAVFLVLMLAFAMTGMALSVLTGWAGQISLGQFAFLGVGAYVATRTDQFGVPVMIAAAGAAAAVASVVVGSVAVRFRGLFLGVVTLAFAFAARSWLFRQGALTDDASAIVRIEHPHLFGIEIATVRTAYVVGAVLLALTALSLRSLRRSSVGRAIVASRDNPELAASYGLPPIAARLAALGIAGFVTGMAGAIWAMGAGSWSFSAFDPSMSFVLLSVVIVGGLGTLHGPILGTVAVFAWPYLVPNANTLAIRSLTSGALLLVTLLFFPGGLAALLENGRRWFVALLASNAPAPFGPDPTADPLVAEDVTVDFGGIRAVDGATIRVGRGEIVGLIGGNGAGKTTLLDVVSGHRQAAAGVVRVAGVDVTDLGPEYRPYLGLSRTFQDARLFPGLTVLETVIAAADRNERSGVVGAMVASPWSRVSERRKRERAGAVLRDFGLADRAQDLTGELSTGMRRVCDLAAIVASEPTLVVLDEPTAGLAQREVEAFAPLLRSIRDRHGASMLVVEHDMPLLMSLCDRIYCLETGRVIAEGTPAEVRADPSVIASYLGTVAASVDRSGRPARRRREVART
jgi:ABC-type branched-subunit amino acid transport system ATPase component/ABC-type branched-subunit amino acid transport system permease subunit